MRPAACVSSQTAMFRPITISSMADGSSLISMWTPGAMTPAIPFRAIGAVWCLVPALRIHLSSVRMAWGSCSGTAAILRFGKRRLRAPSIAPAVTIREAFRQARTSMCALKWTRQIFQATARRPSKCSSTTFRCGSITIPSNTSRPTAFATITSRWKDSASQGRGSMCLTI